MKIEECIKDAYDSIVLFNKMAGNLPCTNYESVDNQLSYIFEEFTETVDALETGIIGDEYGHFKLGEKFINRIELLDGACDLFVTVVGLLAKLESMGYNVGLAMQRVNENNLSKFPEFRQPLKYDPRFTAQLMPEFDRYVIKDDGGKVRKPSDFQPVDLSDLVPTQ